MQYKVRTKSKRNAPKVILLSLVAFLIVFSTISMLVVKYLYDSQFQRFDKREYTGYLKFSDLEGYNRSVVKFKSGKNTLTGYVYGLENDRGLVVIAHGLGGGAEDYLAETIYFVDNGWRVFSFDCTGTYESEGKSTRGLPQSVIDLDAALTFVKNDPDLESLPLMLYGHSWGGYAVTSVLNYDHVVRGVVSIAGFNSPMDMLIEQAKNMIGFFANVVYPFEWAYQTMLFGKVAGHTAVDGINNTEAAVMIIHGTEDTTILYDGASIISRQKEITNPKVIYKGLSEPNRNGHNNLMLSESALEYIAEKNKVFRALYDLYSGNIPDDVRKEYYADVDRFKTTELNQELMEEINSFYESLL